MEKLTTIQKRENLNDIYAVDEKGNGGAYHKYIVCKSGETSWSLGNNDIGIVGEIRFQNGPRNKFESQDGLTTSDLLEICRNQLTSFQNGDMRTREGAIALTHIEEALLWLNKRVEDRIERNVLGTMEK